MRRRAELAFLATNRPKLMTLSLPITRPEHILRVRELPATFRMENANRRRRILIELRNWPDRARSQVAAAVGAPPAKLVLNAIATERALECADHGVRCIWPQIFIAAFAIGAQFKHQNLVEAGGEIKAPKRNRTQKK